MTVSEIVVVVPTFHRLRVLEPLLGELKRQAGPLPARVLVIDNDSAGSARDVATMQQVDYVVEPARGLAAVRNRALDEAAQHKALIFIDDDEWPEPDWLHTLVLRWRDSGAAAVSGRVETRMPSGVEDPWIEAGGFFRRVRFEDGARQPVAATNNLLLDLAFVRTHRLRFDEAFGLSGGEDILFTKQLVRAGGIIVSCPAALVYDVAIPERLTRSWVLRRAYRVGNSSVRTDLRIRSSVVARIRACAHGLARIVLGSIRWIGGQIVRSPRHSARGARAVFRGAGMLTGSLGMSYREYARR